MKAIQTFAACALLLSGIANAAPDFNGTVKGTVNKKQVNVKVVCEREKMGASDWLKASSDPSMGGDAKDLDGDGIAVKVNVDIGNAGAAFTVLLDGREYKFGQSKGLKLTPTGVTIKNRFSPGSKVPQPDKAFDVDLTLDCP